MLILLTNDDGIYAPGLAALEREMSTLGEVVVVAPATEQSGVGHSITYLTPLIVKEVFRSDGGSGGERRWGWAVEGSPADCVKIGILQFCPRPPDLVISGINGGLNAGINVLYSGTVAAAIEGAFFGITSVAVSLEFDEHARFDLAARIAREIVSGILEQQGDCPDFRAGDCPDFRASENGTVPLAAAPTSAAAPARLYNLNIPTAALAGAPEVCVVPMNVTRYGDSFEKRHDPWGREYFWLKGGPPEAAVGHETDLSALAKGKVTITPLDYNMTHQAALSDMQRWQFPLAGAIRDSGDADAPPSTPTMRTHRRKQKV
jgi:5'-nucleotidase